MGNILTPYSIAVGYKNVYFSTPHFKFVSKKLNDDDELLNTDEDPIDLFNYPVSNCEKDTFKKLRSNKTFSNYD